MIIMDIVSGEFIHSILLGGFQHLEYDVTVFHCFSLISSDSRIKQKPVYSLSLSLSSYLYTLVSLCFSPFLTLIIRLPSSSMCVLSIIYEDVVCFTQTNTHICLEPLFAPSICLSACGLASGSDTHTQTHTYLCIYMFTSIKTQSCDVCLCQPDLNQHQPDPVTPLSWLF